MCGTYRVRPGTAALGAGPRHGIYLVRMRRRLLPAAIVVAAALGAAPAHASGPAPYDGSIPFLCTLQQVGQGTAFPEPDADPFCVEYDKTHQNVDQLGVVDFLSKEPARVAAASPKCFYFQRDHWTGYVSESQPQTRTYHWDGSYFFDKSRGTGGAYVENLSFAGQSGDPTQLPGFPEAWKPYFGQGRGGVQQTGDVPVDPSCVAKAGGQDPHRPSTRTPGGYGPNPCRVPGGLVTTGIGGIFLGDRRSAVKQALGLPTTESSRFLTYCFDGGGRLVAGFGAGDRAQLVLTDAAPFDSRGVRVGMSKANAGRHLLGRKHLRTRAVRSAISVVNGKRRLIAGLAHGRVSYLAVAPRRMPARTVSAWLRQVPPSR
jgi:hypothetical protein